jgi:hypothetical protein
MINPKVQISIWTLEQALRMKRVLEEYDPSKIGGQNANTQNPNGGLMGVDSGPVQDLGGTAPTLEPTGEDTEPGSSPIDQ